MSPEKFPGRLEKKREQARIQRSAQGCRPPEIEELQVKGNPQ
jgi:hypothetical protein